MKYCGSPRINLEFASSCLSFISAFCNFGLLTIISPSKVIEYSPGITNLYELTNESFNFPAIDLEEIKGSSAKENAQIIYNLFSKKEKNAAYKVVVANAALAIKVSGLYDNLEDCLQAAENSILTGKALDKLNALKSFGDNN